MSPTIEVPYTDAERDEAIEAAYVDQGYIDEDGEPDSGPLADAIAERVLEHKASKKSERVGVALRREKLMEELFPTVPGPNDYGRQPNPDLAKSVYEGLLRDVWSLCSPNHNSPVQQRVGNAGLVLCRIALSGGRTQDAFYVTDDWACIAEDFCPAYRRKAFTASERYGKQMEMIARRLPGLASKAKREFDTGMDAALQAGANAMAPALAAAQTSENGSGSSEAQ